MTTSHPWVRAGRDLLLGTQSLQGRAPVPAADGQRQAIIRQAPSASRRSAGLIVFGILSAAVTPGTMAGEWHVDNAATGTGDGRSWANAWRSFRDVNWSGLSAGDTLLISGGPRGQTYRERLVIGAGGTLHRPLIIKASSEPERNGKVIIDGENRLEVGVSINGHNHLVVSGLNIRNMREAAIDVRNVTAGILIENNYVFSGDPGSGNARGFEVRHAVGRDAVIVQNNRFATPLRTRAQTDGIWSSSNDGVVFRGNHIEISNTDSTGHSDGIQSFRDTNISIVGNFFAHPNGGQHNHGIWITSTAAGGTVKVYNNIVAMPAGDEIAISHWNQDPGWTGRVQIWNNTIFGGYYCYQLRNSPLSEIRNNICYPSPGRVGVNLVGSRPDAEHIDHNLIWAPLATIATIDYAAMGWAQWRALGYDVHGVNADPRFKDASRNDFTLAADSPAINAGVAPPGTCVGHGANPGRRCRRHNIGAYWARSKGKLSGQ